MKPDEADDGDGRAAPNDPGPDITATERDLTQPGEMEELLRRIDADEPVIRPDVVDAARAWLVYGDRPSADEIAITLIDEMTVELVDEPQH